MRTKTIIVGAAILLAVPALPIPGVPTPALRAADLTLQDLYFRPVRLDAVAGEAATVLFFFSNTCPIARRYMPRVAQLEGEYRARGVRFIAVNASPADTVRDSAQHAMEYEVGYPVLKDADFSAVRVLGVTRTPEVVLLDDGLEVAYQGRIDDQYRFGGARPEAGTRDLADALDAILDGNEAPQPRTQAEGCVVTYPIPPQAADNLTYEADVRPVFAEHCISCHRAGGFAPFPLETREQLLQHKESLLRVILHAQMPPWPATSNTPLSPPPQLTLAQQHRVVNWLAGPVIAGPPSGAPVEPIRYDRFFQAATAGPWEAVSRTVDVTLEPALAEGLMARALHVEGRHEDGFLGAAIYLEDPSRPGERRYLSGPLLPGQPLRWEEGEAVRIPAGAVLGLSARYAGRPVAAPALKLSVESTPGPVDSEIVCLREFTEVRPRSHEVTRVKITVPKDAELRGIAADYPDFGASLTVDFTPVDGRAVRVLDAPTLDPRWPHSNLMDAESEPFGRGGEVGCSLRFPGYLSTWGVYSLPTSGEITYRFALFTYIALN